MEFSKEDKRKLVCYFYMKGLSPPEIAEEICSVLGNDAISARTCQRWSANFRNENFNTEQAKGAGRPSKDLNEEIKESLNVNALKR